MVLDLKRAGRPASKMVCGLVWLAATFGAPGQEPLFLEGNAGGRERAESGGALLRSRNVQLNRSLWRGKASPFRPGGEVRLNLFQSADFVMRVARVDESGPGRRICAGTVNGAPGSHVLLVMNGEIVAGTVMVPPAGRFQILYAGDGTHRITQLDSEGFPGCGTSAPAIQARPISLQSMAGVSADRVEERVGGSSTEDPVTVDVMVLYTAQAEEGAGGRAGIETLIDLALAEANSCYRNSDIGVHLNLVYRGWIDYAETGGFSDDLERLSKRGDGFLDSAHALRDLYSADLVCLVLETERSGVIAGIADFTPVPVAEHGFCLVRRPYMTGNYTVAHELAHNFGAQHDRNNTAGKGAFPYSHGHRFEAGGTVYRTVMCYAPGLQIPYFSSPELLYLGIPTGVAEDAPNAADNARGIRNTAATVGSFRNRRTAAEFGARRLEVREGESAAPVTVRRSGELGEPGAVSVLFMDGTARAGADYQVESRTIEFAAGEQEKTITVALVDDALIEDTETVLLSLADPTPGISFTERSTAVLAILDDDGGPSDLVDVSFDPGAGADYSIDVIRVQPDGKLVVAGGFSSFNGAAKNRIARLTGSGTLDPGFSSEAETKYRIYSAALDSDARIVLAGHFNRVNGILINRVARLRADGVFDSEFIPGKGANDFVFSVAVQPDAKVVIGGIFASVNDLERRGIARLLANGAVDRDFNPGAGANGPVYDVLLLEDGRILAAGGFNRMDGIFRKGIARLNANGSIDTSFDPEIGITGEVHCLASQTDGRILIGGRFSSVTGVARGSLARLLPGGVIDLSFDPGQGIDGAVHTISLSPSGAVYVGGEFSSVNGIPRQRLARLNPDGSLDPTFDPRLGADDSIYTSALQADGRLLIGGLFTRFDGVARNRIARLYAEAIRLAAPRLEAGGLVRLQAPGQSGRVYALEVSSNLIEWTALKTATAADQMAEFIDEPAAGLPARFYRIRAE